LSDSAIAVVSYFTLSDHGREQLRAYKGLDIYLSLLDDKDWAVTAIDSLAVCLAHDNEQRKVESVLLKPESLLKLVEFFRSCGGNSFVQILEPFLKMIKCVTCNNLLILHLSESGFFLAIFTKGLRDFY
jgi:hypothetical protein